MTDRPSTPADATPVDPAAAPALREEIAEARKEVTGIHQIADLIRGQQAAVVDELARMRAAVGPLSDAVREMPADVARLVAVEGEKLRLRSSREWTAAIAASDEAGAKRLRIAIGAQCLLAERDKKLTDAKIEAVDHRVDELSLHVGAGLHRTNTQIEGFVSRHKQPIAASAGSTGLTLAVVSLAPVVWPSIKAGCALAWKWVAG